MSWARSGFLFPHKFTKQSFNQKRKVTKMKYVLFLLACFAFIATADVNAQGTSINATQVAYIEGGNGTYGQLDAGYLSSWGAAFRSYIRWSAADIRAAIPPHTVIQNAALNNAEPWDQILNGPTPSTYIYFKILPSVSNGSNWTSDYNAIGSANTAASILYTVQYYGGYYHLTSPSNPAVSFSALTSTLQGIVNGTSNNDLIIGIQNSDEQNSGNFFSSTYLNSHQISITVSWTNVTVSLAAPTYVEPGSGAYYTISSLLINGQSNPDQGWSSGGFPQGGDVTVTAHSPTNTRGQTWSVGWIDGSGVNPRVINPSSTFSSWANWKELQHSTDVSAFTNNSQRKLVRTRDGWLHLVYTSMGRVWLEESTDGGSTWFLGNNGQPLDNGQGKNPSMDWNYDGVWSLIVVAFQQPYGNGNYSERVAQLTNTSACETHWG
jgi:hypothetical protein